MKMYRTILGLGVGLLAALVVQAQAPAAAPAGTTGLCKDGSYYSGASKQGACRGHKGVKEWYGASGAAPAAAAPAVAAPAKAASHRTSKKERAAAEAAAAPAAATPATAAAGPAPAGATGLCKDGSYYSGATKQGACRGHKGVKDWYGAASVAAAPAAAASTPRAAVPAAPAAAAPAAAAPAAATAAAPAAPRYTPPATAAPGGGAGQVWVNTKSKVYHCQGDFNYGKTKEGEYMTEAAAKAAGARAARGKACQ